MPIDVPGVVIAHNGQYLLVYGSEANALGVPTLAAPVSLWPGYRLWEAPTYFLPNLIVDDIGQEFEPPESYQWLEERGDLFPRSEAYGRLIDGSEKGFVVKAMDLTDLRVFAANSPDGPFLPIALAIEAEAVPDNLAVVPVPAPAPIVARALPAYRIAPGTFGAVGAALLNHLLAHKRRDFRLTFDELDDMLGPDA